LALDGVGRQHLAPFFFPRNELVLIWKFGIVVGLQDRSVSLRKTVTYRESMLGHSSA
jgi:hypothetical protein